MSEESIQALNSSCKIANDEVTFKLRYFDILSGFFELESIERYMRWRGLPLVGNYFSRAVIHKIYFVYEVSVVLVEACEEVMQKFEESFPVHPNHLRYVLEEVHENVEAASTYIS